MSGPRSSNSRTSVINPKVRGWTIPGMRHFLSQIPLNFLLNIHLWVNKQKYIYHKIQCSKTKNSQSLTLAVGGALGKNCEVEKFSVWNTWSVFSQEHPVMSQQGKSEGFDSCDRHSNLTQIGFKSSIFQLVWTWNLMDDPRETIGHLFYGTLSFLHHFVAIGEYKLELQSGNA